jgi:CBS domain-containing protein
MTDEHDTISLPVRSLEIVSADGSRRRHLRVFCPVESRSLDPRTCGRCDLCVSIPDDMDADGAELRCRIPRRTDPPHATSWFIGTEAISTWLPAGVIAGRRLLCVRLDASVRAVGEALERTAASTAVVVDERTRVLGVVGQADLRAREDTPVLAVVDADVPRVLESAPLADVIASMAYGRAHRVVLVRSDGNAAGLVTEVDVLHWIAVGGSRW